MTIAAANVATWNTLSVHRAGDHNVRIPKITIAARIIGAGAHCTLSK
jgi:hypothetical protein